jgi:hypothetical protein
MTLLEKLTDEYKLILDESTKDIKPEIIEILNKHSFFINATYYEVWRVMYFFDTPDYNLSHFPNFFKN